MSTKVLLGIPFCAGVDAFWPVGSGNIYYRSIGHALRNKFEVLLLLFDQKEINSNIHILYNIIETVKYTVFTDFHLPR